MKVKTEWAKGIGLLLILILVFVLILHYPQLFIQKKFTYKSFHIYSNASLELDTECQNTLDLVLENLKQSDYYKSSQEHHIFFVHDTFYEKLVRLIGYKNMAFAFMNRSVYCAIPDFKTRKLHRNDNEYEVMDLVQVITHEGVHNQMYDCLSFSGVRKTPTWINEGYPEYIAYLPIRNSANYNLLDLVKRIEKDSSAFWIRNEYGTWTTRPYALDRAKIEFLLDLEKMKIEEVRKGAKLNSEKIYQELKTQLDFD